MNDASPTIRLLNPRPVGDANCELIKRLNSLELSLINCPSIEIVPKRCTFTEHTHNPIDCAIFTSQFAVEHGASFFVEKRNQASFSVIAIGKQTERALRQKGFQRTLIAKKESSESLLESLPQPLNGLHLALVKGVGGRTFLAENIKRLRCQLSIFEVYTRKKPKNLAKQLKKIELTQPIELALATSIETCDNLLECASRELLAALKHSTWLAKSERIEQYLLQKGFVKIVIAEQDLFSTIKSVVDATSYNLSIKEP